jgi:A/G-specific adenine glycosylase
LLPEKNLKQAMPRYTQGVMDLGATICSTRNPQCLICPVQSICKGFAEGLPEKYPVKTKKLKRTMQHLSLLWARRADGAVWLESRPDAGIWGGLYCLPVFDSDSDLLEFLPQSKRLSVQKLPPFKHVLTHKDMYLSPVMVELAAHHLVPSVQHASGSWFLPEAWQALGLPAPIRKLLENDPV